jgi:ATP phosphoribosyltransferase-like protein
MTTSATTARPCAKAAPEWVFVAVHAVVAERAVYRTIARLKELGCEGILVTRIERLTP